MYDHKLHVAQEQHDSREPRAGGDELCDHCLQPRSKHRSSDGDDGTEWCTADWSDDEQFTPLTEQSERELRAAMRGDL